MCILQLINNATLFSPVAKQTKVGGLPGARTRRLVNSKEILEVTVGRRLSKEQHKMSADMSGHIYVARGEIGSWRSTGSTQLVIVGRRAIVEKIRGRIQQEGAGGVRGRKAPVACFRGKVGRLGAPDARDERERGLGRSRRTGVNKWTGLSECGLDTTCDNSFFADIYILFLDCCHS